MEEEITLFRKLSLKMEGRGGGGGKHGVADPIKPFVFY
jgi:hypothetical protein